MSRNRSQSYVRKGSIAEINVVPYIDVMLVLLIIFMVTAPLLNQGVAVDLPRANAEPLPLSEQRTLVLDVDSTGAYYLYLAGDVPEALAPAAALTKAAAMLQRYPDITVLVKADTNVDYGTVVQAMVLLQQAGADKVGLATKPLNQP